MIALLAVVVLVGVGFWYVSTQRDVVSPEPTATPTPEIQELTSTVDTSDWIQWSSFDYHLFSFMYPPTWEKYAGVGGNYLYPIDDENFVLSGPRFNTQNDSIESVLDTLIGNQTFINQEISKFTMGSRKIIVLKYTDTSDGFQTPAVYIMIDSVPMESLINNSEIEQRVLVFSTIDRRENSENNELYLETILNIISTLDVQE